MTSAEGMRHSLDDIHAYIIRRDSNLAIVLCSLAETGSAIPMSSKTRPLFTSLAHTLRNPHNRKTLRYMLDDAFYGDQRITDTDDNHMRRILAHAKVFGEATVMFKDWPLFHDLERAGKVTLGPMFGTFSEKRKLRIIDEKA